MLRGFPVDNKNIRAHSKRNPDCKRSRTNGIIYKLNTKSDNFILSLDLVQTVFPVKNLSSQLTHQELTLKLTESSQQALSLRHLVSSLLGN